MKILSFDVGIKNLAYCVYEDAILAWESVNLFEEDTNVKKVALQETATRLLVALDERFGDDFACDVVLIENQPVQKNPTMKSVQMVIYTFFLQAKIKGRVGNVLLFSASNKMKLFGLLPDAERESEEVRALSGLPSYRRNKKLGIYMARYFMQGESELRVSELAASKKKDDLCDAYLQALFYCKR